MERWRRVCVTNAGMARKNNGVRSLFFTVLIHIMKNEELTIRLIQNSTQPLNIPTPVLQGFAFSKFLSFFYNCNRELHPIPRRDPTILLQAVSKIHLTPNYGVAILFKMLTYSYVCSAFSSARVLSLNVICI